MLILSFFIPNECPKLELYSSMIGFGFIVVYIVITFDTIKARKIKNKTHEKI